MNKHFLKNIRDNMPEPLKYLTASLFRNKLIKSKSYLQFERMLLERAELDEDTIQKNQFIDLKEILIYANNYVPYYTELFKKVGFQPEIMQTAKEMEVIPFLTKELIRENFESLISTKDVSGGNYIATTGGSTGEPLKVLLDYDCVFKENAFVNHFRSKLGYKLSDKLATFRGVEFGDKLWKYNPMQNELIFSPFKLSKKTIVRYVNKINSYKPQYLNGYLSSLYFFAKLLSENNLELNTSLKGIFLISENIDRSQRQFIEDFFKVKSSTFYGHSERCIIAEELAPNEYSFDPYYGYTELIDNKDNTYTIVGTGFLNKTMPLIRYKTDDVAIDLFNRKYKIDGSRKSTMGLYGRNDEFFAHAAFNFHSDIFKNVAGYQFIQKQKGIADLLIVVNRQFHIDEIDLMKNEIDKKTKGVILFNIQVVDQLRLSNRGKFKMFISEINHD